jgi:hypothetical protein
MRRWRPQPPAVLGTLYFVLSVLWILGGWDDYKQPHVGLPGLLQAVVLLIVLAFVAYRSRRKSVYEDPQDKQ